MGDFTEQDLLDRLDSYKNSYLSGDIDALLAATELCAKYKIMVPEWVSYSTAMTGMLNIYKKNYLSGDNEALLQAIEWCASYRIVMPDWVSCAFSAANKKFRYCEVRTMDEAFGIQRKKGFNIAKEKKWINKQYKVYMEVLEAERQGFSISHELMESIAKKYFINRQDAWEMYRQARNGFIGRALEQTRIKRR